MRNNLETVVFKCSGKEAYELMLRSNGSNDTIGYYSVKGQTLVGPVASHKMKEVFFMLTFNGEHIHTHRIDFEIEWEFKLLPVYDLMSYLTSGKLISASKPYEREEEDEMVQFGNFLIEDVELGELNTIALKAAIKKLEPIFKKHDIELVRESGELILVKDGSTETVNGDEFKTKLKEQVVGKTVAEISGNEIVWGLLTTLGLINKITLGKSKDGLSGIFG